MPFFDDSHVTDVRLEGSVGPTVGFLDMVQQSFKQQFRVDSARALNTELQNRWIESLRSLESSGGGKFSGPIDQNIYIAFAEHSRGQPISGTWFGTEGKGYGARLVPGDVTQNAYFQEMQRANEAIKKLNNPEIKSFEQILEEVSQMQQEVEAETGAMAERGGVTGFIGQLIGAIGGSFTSRDPLNVVTAPWGVGRTAATRIASEMALAAGITAVSELTEVAPHRALTGLPERNVGLDIVAAAAGAGIIRGGIEGIGYGVSRFRSGSEDIDFDLRDSQLQQMFEANSEKPSARAGAMLLDDAVFLERNNPLGEGRAAQERFMAELQQVQRAMNGEPMTAVARVLPPLPFEYIKKAADFEIVREQAPDVYARMETAQARIQELRARVTGIEGQIKNTNLRPEIFYHGSTASDILEFRSSAELGRTDSHGIYVSSDRKVARAFSRGADLREGTIYPVQIKLDNPLIIDAPPEPGAFGKILDKLYPERIKARKTEVHQGSAQSAYLSKERIEELKAQGYDGIINRNSSEVVLFDSNQIVHSPDTLKQVRQQARQANQEYQAAYREVEAEAARLREKQTRAEATQQRESSNILAQAMEGRPFVGPLLRHDNVEALVDRINRINETLDEEALAAIQRAYGSKEEELTVGRYVDLYLAGQGRGNSEFDKHMEQFAANNAEAIEAEFKARAGRPAGIDIGLKDPVDPNFAFVTDDGEMTVAAAMRDLQDDVDLVEAIKVCAI